MANNRMFLRIIDQPETEIALAKYYSHTGWRIAFDRERYNKWFEKHSMDFSMTGKTNMEIIFEEKD